MSNPKAATVRQVSEETGVNPVTIREWVRRKRIRALRTPGGLIRIPWAEVQRLREVYGVSGDETCSS